VSIKVDREERPDLDQIYMHAVQLMTGRGGWPMSVFLTPDLKPFYGGTYWPPASRMGMPGFDQVLLGIVNAWQTNRQAVNEQAEQLTGYLREGEASGGRPPPEAIDIQSNQPDRLTIDLLHNAGRQLARAFDHRHGGFGSAPKFPHSMDLQLLLRLWKRQPREDLLKMVTLTLDKMAAGGIYDHLAGGFARYSVDERWLVPHFEKMLYDNALLTGAHLDAYQATREPRFARTARDICTYVLGYMTDAAGGFHSTEDADSEGEEGKFYVWTPAEIKQVLGEEAGERFCYVYDVSEAGNFEHGKSILNLPKSIEQCAAVRGWDLSDLQKELVEGRSLLLALRDTRVRPAKDDKILVSWNGLMIDSLARAGAILDQPHYLALAEAAADFILTEMSREDGRLLHTWRHGQAKLDAYLDDYACFANALVTLYESTLNERWIEEAVRLADVMLARFEDQQHGGFFFTADDHEVLIARNKDLQDASVPSGNAMAATALIRLGKLTGRTDFLEAARRAILAGLPLIERSPAAAGQLLIALDLWLGPLHELVLAGGVESAENRQAIAELQQAYLPNAVWAYRPSEGAAEGGALAPAFAGKSAQNRQVTCYVCRDFACQSPAVGLSALREAIQSLNEAQQ
jgi:uncharacterized protein YyaL (SSP411 family)